MDTKIIGVIGGMGPLATVDFLEKIVKNTKAEKDQDHMRVFIDHNPSIPDRTAAILHHGETPLPSLVKSAVALEAMGAGVLVIPCNTAHYYHHDVQRSVGVPLLNMIELTQKALRERGIKVAGLLSTEGMLKSGIYQRVLAEGGIEVIAPDDEQQKIITDMIYRGVKAGNYNYDATDAKQVMNDLLERGAEILVLGCTELPLAVEMYGLDYETCDPATELAIGAIKAAGGQLRE